MMNKKFLICGAIITGLLLTACVKKETPTEEPIEQQADTSEVASEIITTEFTTLEATEEPTSDTETIQLSESESTAPAIPATPINEPATKPAEPAKAQDTPSNYTAPAKTNTGFAQSEDEAVADAIAAAMPALEN